nr:MAG TPA: hypothetical protein [Caudoviricetes sp.]DAY55099.1 MAG TPA: hypothetical protein [Caudoviricetes sp.]
MTSKKCFNAISLTISKMIGIYNGLKNKVR